jgi:hypothetical protein
MNDDFEPGAIIRLNFFFRPEIEPDPKTGKPVITAQTGNGKPRNGLVVMRNGNKLSVLPITHHILSTKSDRLYKLPNKLLRETEKLHTNEPSYLLCDQINEIDPMHHNVFATSKGRQGNPRVYGIADYRTLTRAQGILADVMREDALYAQQHKRFLDVASAEQKRFYRVEKPLWKYIHPTNNQSERELSYPSAKASDRASGGAFTQRQAKIKAAAQRVTSQETVASKFDRNATSKDKPNGRSRDWER